MSSNIGISAPTTRTEVTAGQTIEIPLTVINQSQIVDHYKVKIEGLDPTWWALSIPTFSLFPGDKGESKLIIHPPKDAGAKAGGYSFRITATSEADPQEMTTIENFLILHGFIIWEVDMSPTKVTGCNGIYKITANNSGNTDAIISFQGKDAEEGLIYKFDHNKITVPAGVTTRTQLAITPKKGENKKLYSFQVICQPAIASGTTKDIKVLTGNLEYRRKRKFLLWFLILILGLLVAAIIVYKVIVQSYSPNTEVLPLQPANPPTTEIPNLKVFPELFRIIK